MNWLKDQPFLVRAGLLLALGVVVVFLFFKPTPDLERYQTRYCAGA